MPDKPMTSLIRIEVRAAKGLRDADLGGKSDPYAVVSFPDGNAFPEKQKTPVVENNLNPQWNSEFYFLVDDDCTAIKVKLYDQDIGGDDSLGHCHILRKKGAAQSEASDEWVYLEKGKGGTVNVVVQEVDVSSHDAIQSILSSRASKLDEALKSRGSTILLHTCLHSAQGLKSGMLDKSDPYAIVHFKEDKLGDQVLPEEARTKTIDNMSNPKWDTSFNFLVPSQLRTCRVDVYDEDIGKDDSLGHSDIPLEDFNKMEKKQYKNSKKGRLNLSYALLPLNGLFDVVPQSEMPAEPSKSAFPPELPTSNTGVTSFQM